MSESDPILNTIEAVISEIDTLEKLETVGIMKDHSSELSIYYTWNTKEGIPCSACCRLLTKEEAKNMTERLFLADYKEPIQKMINRRGRELEAKDE